MCQYSTLIADSYLQATVPTLILNQEQVQNMKERLKEVLASLRPLPDRSIDFGALVNPRVNAGESFFTTNNVQPLSNTHRSYIQERVVPYFNGLGNEQAVSDFIETFANEIVDVARSDRDVPFPNLHNLVYYPPIYMPSINSPKYVLMLRNANQPKRTRRLIGVLRWMIFNETYNQSIGVPSEDNIWND